MLKPTETSFTLSDLASFEDASALAELAPDVEIRALERHEVESTADSYVYVITRYETTGYDVDPDQQAAFREAVEAYGEAYGKEAFFNTVGEGMYYEYTDTPAKIHSALTAAVDLRMIDDSEVFDILMENDEVADAVHGLLRQATESEEDADLIILLAALGRSEVDEVLARSSKFLKGVLELLGTDRVEKFYLADLRRVAEVGGLRQILEILDAAKEAKDA